MESFEIPGTVETPDKFSTTLLEDRVIPSGFAIAAAREACRALKGHLLRTELYSEDKSPQAEIPYIIMESNYTVRLLQTQDVHGHSVFTVVPRETLKFSFERKLNDPRVQHCLVIEVDKYGNPLKTANIAYGRHLSTLRGKDRDTQEKLLMTYVENSFTNNIDKPNTYLLPRQLK
jgi:hypothetical protein